MIIVSVAHNKIMVKTTCVELTNNCLKIHGKSNAVNLDQRRHSAALILKNIVVKNLHILKIQLNSIVIVPTKNLNNVVSKIKIISFLKQII